MRPSVKLVLGPEVAGAAVALVDSIWVSVSYKVAIERTSERLPVMDLEPN